MFGYVIVKLWCPTQAMGVDEGDLGGGAHGGNGGLLPEVTTKPRELKATPSNSSLEEGGGAEEEVAPPTRT